MASLSHYDWPGNVRELENAMERALVLGSSDVILPEDLPETVLEKELPSGSVMPAKFNESVQELKKNLILNFELRGAVRPFPSARTGLSRTRGRR